MDSYYNDTMFLEPWYYIGSDYKNEVEIVEKELYKELCSEHQLFGHKMIAVARREGQDDVLFCFNEDKSRLAEVHLTWKGGIESSPTWPRTKIYTSFKEWSEKRMIPENQDFSL